MNINKRLYNPDIRVDSETCGSIISIHKYDARGHIDVDFME